MSITRETTLDFYLSLETAETLKKWGCDVPSEKMVGSEWETSDTFYPGVTTYHILEDVCVRYSGKFFGKGAIKIRGTDVRFPFPNEGICSLAKNEFHSLVILSYLQLGQKDEAEKYLLEHTLFNPWNR